MKKLIAALFLAANAWGAFNGTTQGTPTFAAAKFSNGLTAVTDANYITLPTGTYSLITTNSSWTIEAWLKGSGAALKVAITVSSGSNTIWMGQTATGTFAASMNGTGAFVGGATLDSGIGIADGSYHHCALVMQNGTTVRLFVDGTQGGGAFSGQISVPGSTTGSIGNFQPQSAGFAWPGGIDEMVIWPTAKYTSNFTAPVAAYTGNEGMQSLYHLQADGTDSSTNSFVPTIFASDSNILYTGRWSVTGSSTSARAKTITAGAWLEMAVSGTANITIGFDNTGLNASGYPDVTYQVDGGSYVRTTLTSSTLAISVSFPAAGLLGHHLKVWCDGITEGSNPAFDQWNSQAGACNFAGISTDGGAVTLPIGFLPNTMEALGDSIVATVRLLNNCGGGSNSNATCMGAHQGWAAQTCGYLGLNCVMSGYGGAGLTVTGSGSVPILNTAFASNFSGSSYTATLKPTVVVIEPGTNDGAASSGAFQTAMVTYLTTIRSAYPKAVIFAVGLPSNTHATDMSTAVSTFADPKTFYLNYTSGIFTTTAGVDTTDGTHPNLSGAAKIAAKLSSDIQTQLAALGITLPAAGTGGLKAWPMIVGPRSF